LKDGDGEGARGILAGLIDDDEEAPCPRMVVKDTTEEKLGRTFERKTSGSIRDELTVFREGHCDTS